MPSIPETAIRALFAVLDTVATGSGRPQRARNTDVPQAVPPEGLIILRDGDPGDADIVLSPLTYSYDHVVDVELYATGAPATSRAASLDDLILAVGVALAAAGPTLGGAVEDCRPAAPKREIIPIPGGGGIAAALVPVTLSYSIPTPLS